MLRACAVSLLKTVTQVFRATRYNRGGHGVVNSTGYSICIMPGIGLISVHSTELTIFLIINPFGPSFLNFSLNSLKLGLIDLIIHGYVVFIFMVLCVLCIFMLHSLNHIMLHVS